MTNSNLKLSLLNENDIGIIQKIWHKSLPYNLKSIIGQKLIKKYLLKYFKREKNLAFGLYETNKIVGFVLFGNDKNIFNDLFKENFFFIIKSFLANFIKFKIKNLVRYFNVFIYTIFFKSKEKNLGKNICELIIIAIEPDKKNRGYGSFMLKNCFDKFYNYFSEFDFIFVKTLKTTPENISFYKKNKFEFLYEIFGRVYLKLKVLKNY